MTYASPERGSGDSASRHGAYAQHARSHGANDGPSAEAALSRLADDPQLIERIRRHQLISLLWTAIPAETLRALLPPAAFHAFDEWFVRPRPSALDNLRTFTEAQAALRSVSVDCMLLKGAYFAQRLYGGLERRTQFDVDLLVRGRDFRAAATTLRVLGFVERWRDLHSATWRRGDARIDLHAKFRNAPAYRLDEARIWRDRIASAVGGVAFTTPSDEDTLVLLALSLFQDVGLGATKLRQLVDIDLLLGLLAERVDFARFIASRRREGTLPIVVNVLDLVLRVFDAGPERARIASALGSYRDLVAAPERAQALALVFAERSALANKSWFFRVYPGSLARYWLWLLPRKLPLYLSGKAPNRAPSSMRPSFETIRVLMGARRSTAGRERRREDRA